MKIHATISKTRHFAKFVAFFTTRKKARTFYAMQKTIYCDDYDNLLQWLKKKRIGGKLTMRQLAMRLDVHHSWVGRVELGERRLDVMEFVRYCNALEADPFEGLACLAKPAVSPTPRRGRT